MMNLNYGFSNMMDNQYWGGYFGHWATPLGFVGLAFTGIVLLVFIAWSLYWKGRAMWHAAQDHSKIWFVVLLLVNTLGILDILYIYVFSKQARK